jgi:methionyl-tRNA formyltransferase
VFFGTPRWAVPSLRELLRSDYEVVAAVTNPDRPSGRGMDVQPSPVKSAAVEADVRVLQPEKARDPEFHDALAELAPDCCVVVAYGKILPGSLLTVPRLGFVNVHFSILPSYRGAAPVQRALMNGVDETGVSIMVLTEGMDEGPVLATEALAVRDDDTAGDVGDELAERGGRLLIEALRGYSSGALQPVEQDHERATYAPKITTDEARIDWNSPAARIRDLVRALNPAPGAWTTVGDKRLKVFRVAPADAAGLGPGELRVDDELLVGTGAGALILDDVQPAGKRRMRGAEFARGLREETGVRLR